MQRKRQNVQNKCSEKIIIFITNSEFYYQFYYEMSNKCHDQISVHGKNNNGIDSELK